MPRSPGRQDQEGPRCSPKPPTPAWPVPPPASTPGEASGVLGRCHQKGDSEVHRHDLDEGSKPPTSLCASLILPFCLVMRYCGKCTPSYATDGGGGQRACRGAMCPLETACKSAAVERRPHATTRMKPRVTVPVCTAMLPVSEIPRDHRGTLLSLYRHVPGHAGLGVTTRLTPNRWKGEVTWHRGESTGSLGDQQGAPTHIRRA